MAKLPTSLVLMLLVFGLLVASPSHSVAGQSSQLPPVQSVTIVRSPAAVALLDNTLTLMAPPSVRLTLQSALIAGTVTSAADSSTVMGTFSLKFSGNDFYLDSMTPSHRRRLSYIHGSGRVDADGKIGPVHNSGFSDLYSDVFPLLDAWSSYSHNGIGVELGVDTVINGLQCSEIKLRFPSRTPLFGHRTHDVHVFLSKETGLLVAVDYAATQTRFYSEVNRMRVIYEEYRLLDGVYTPTLIRRYFNGQALSVLRITSLNIHQNIDAASFVF